MSKPSMDLWAFRGKLLQEQDGDGWAGDRRPAPRGCPISV